MWAVGVISYFLITGEYPFVGDEISPVNEQITEEDPHWNIITVKGFSKHSQDLIKKLLHKVPAKRYSTAQALAHPWFKLAESRMALG